MFKGILDIIKYELNKNWKIMIGSAFVVYGLKIIFVLMNATAPGKAAGIGLLISLWVLGFLTIFLFSQAITSEYQNNTIPFFLTSSIPRRNILLGKMIGNLIVLSGVCVLISFSITPGLICDLDWYQDCISFCLMFGWPILSLILFASIFTVFVSIFCSTTVKTMIISTTSLILIFIAQGAFLGFEAYYMIHLMFSIVFLAGSIQMFSKGDIYSFRHLTKKSAPVLIVGTIACLIFLMGMTSYWDKNDTFGTSDKITSVIRGKFDGKTWVNRYKKMEHMSAPSLKEEGITYRDKDGNWKQYGIRHMSVVSIAPDGSTMLVKETRNFMNLYARGHCTLFVVDVDGKKHKLGMYYSNRISENHVFWTPDNELVIVNPPPRKYRRYDKPVKSIVMYYRKELINCLGFIETMRINEMLMVGNGDLLINGKFKPGIMNDNWKVFELSKSKQMEQKMYRNHSIAGKYIKVLEGHKFVEGEEKGKRIITSLNEKYYLSDLSNLSEDKIEIHEQPEFKNKYTRLTEIGWSCFWSETIKIKDKKGTKLYSIRKSGGNILKDEYIFDKRALSHGFWNSSGDMLAFRTIKETDKYKDLDPEKGFENSVLSRKVNKNGNEIVPTYLWSYYNRRVLKKSKLKLSVFVWDLKSSKGPVCLKTVDADYRNFPGDIFWSNDKLLGMTIGKSLLEIKLD